MKVAFWGTFDRGKPRNRILLRGLEENGAEVLLCHTDVWQGVEDKSRLRGLRRLGFLLRWLAAYPGLVVRYLRLPRHDVTLVGYLGQLDVLVLWPFARLRGIPVVWDAFLSLYDTVVYDRALVRPGHSLARLLYLWEWLAARAASRVLLDTHAHAESFARTFHLPQERVSSVLVGAEPEMFPAAGSPVGEGPVRVLFYGQLIPLHGIETILRAAQKDTKDDTDDFEWVIIGQGQEEGTVRRMLEAAPAERLRWIPWVPYAELAEHIRAADVCLGIFGSSAKAGNVIPNKVFQIVSCGKPVITRDSPAIRELLADSDPGVYLVPPADPDALLAALRRFHSERASLILPLHTAARQRITPQAVGRELREILAAPRRHPLFGLAAPELGWVPAPRYALRRARLLALAANLDRGRLLEIGPGAGALLADFAGLGFTCDAVESSADAFRLASRLNTSPAVHLRSDPDPAWAETFDVLVACEVLEHIEDDRAALAQWRAWLRPGGHLILSVPAHARRWSATDVWAGHFRRYEKAALRQLLETSGFAVEELECYGFPLSNLVEPFRAWSHARALRRREEAGKATATAQSGVERGLEARLWPLQAGLPGRLLFRAAFRLQTIFRNRDLGTGYLVLAHREP
ncbi:MAG TPA: methyltransferase domain-containing protein [Thermoanaerobaculia bacterium]|jgi:glycosyltransferase involved in cell wall biosynthesis|nr:methyltransferase domain-containing protein [Thermoanaerobaculia bacterium]